MFSASMTLASRVQCDAAVAYSALLDPHPEIRVACRECEYERTLDWSPQLPLCERHHDFEVAYAAYENERDDRAFAHDYEWPEDLAPRDLIA